MDDRPWKVLATAPRDGSKFDLMCNTPEGKPHVVKNIKYGHAPMDKTKMVLWGDQNILSPYFTPMAWDHCK